MKFRPKVVGIILAMLLGLLMLLPTACGCPGGESTSLATSATLAPPTTPTTTEVKGKSFIWKISSATTFVYLLGSVHVASPDIYPLDSVIEDAFASAKYLVVELNVKKINVLAASLLFYKYGTYPKGEGLKDNIDEVLYGRFVFKARNFVNDIIVYTEEYRPWTLLFGDAETIYQNAGYEAEYGMDLHFIDKAIKNDKEIIELETAKYQISQIAAIPDNVIVLAIIYGIDNPVDPEIELKALFDAWTNGDAAEIEQIAFSSLYEEPEIETLYEKMYFERNINMAIKIEEYLADDETYFIVVGAGHLVGEKGLLNLLSEKGYTIEQLYNND